MCLPGAWSQKQAQSTNDCKREKANNDDDDDDDNNHNNIKKVKKEHTDDVLGKVRGEKVATS